MRCVRCILLSGRGRGCMKRIYRSRGGYWTREDTNQLIGCGPHIYTPPDFRLWTFTCCVLHPSSSPPSHRPLAFTNPHSWIFWLAGAAALTAALGGGLSCGNTNIAYCNQLNASIAFAWIQFIIITILLVVIAFIGTSALRRGDRLSSGLIA